MITKEDAARRQLVTSIRLFFENRDLISIHTLAQCAFMVLDNVCEKRGFSRFIEHMVEVNPSSNEEQIYKLAATYRNFFKHADRDPDTFLQDFDDDCNDHILIIAVEDLARLTGKLPVEAQVFQLWYFSVYRERLNCEAYERMIKSIENWFPEIQHIVRAEQKRLGREVLDRALALPELLDDPRTDITELATWR